ncbi:MAG: hypothetical protein MUD12_08745 [Spirochaetes bacterium]|nr:hypothetical protein [Spirochaetota bacterium]
MRDDVESLLVSLSRLQERKLQIIHKLIASDSDKLFSLKAQNTEKLLPAIEEDGQFVSEIDDIDFDSSQIIDRLVYILGIKKEFIFKHLAAINKPLPSGIITVRQEIKTAVTEYLAMHEQLLKLMEAISSEISRDINEIKKIENLDIKKIMEKIDL